MRRAARIDDNQREIVLALRKAGCSVVSLAPIGNGCPDLAVGLRGQTFFLEVKNPEQVPSKRKLTELEERFHRSWRGHLVTVTDVESAFRAVGLLS